MADVHAGERIEALLEGLNEPQREAVTHGEGPLLILAGAGSGKTRVLTHRIAFLLFTGQARPSEILAITFTNKAASEMRSRVERLIGEQTRGMWLMTFHAACARILRAQAERIGFTRSFTIYDQADSRRLVKRSLEDLGVDLKRFTPAAIQSQISGAKNRLRSPARLREEAGSAFEELLAEAYRSYQRELEAVNAMDFDDLLVKTVLLFEADREVRDRYAHSFRHVLVDEYQDTNRAQYSLLRLLVDGEGEGTGHRNLAVVGDDSQSIYSFRGAEVRNILDFERDFPDARVVKLEQNYRSTQRILSAANAVIARNESGIAKRLWSELGDGEQIVVRSLPDEHAEARLIVGEIERLLDEDPTHPTRSDIAVLYRVNAMSRVIEDALTRREIAYQVIGGTKFYERAEIKDAIAYLTLLANPHDVLSFQRIVNTPRRGIGQTSVAKVLAHASSTGDPVRDVAADPASVPGLGAAAVKALTRFSQMLAELHELAADPELSVAELLEQTLKRSGYVEALETEARESARWNEAEGRLENLEQLIDVAREFDEAQAIELAASGEGAAAEGAAAEDVAADGAAAEVASAEVASAEGVAAEGVAADGAAAEVASAEGAAAEDVAADGAAAEVVAAERTNAGGVAAEGAAAEDARPQAADQPASEPPLRPLDRFLQESALRADADSRSDEDGLVTLMSMHNAKGLEYPIVFIAACEEGVFPHSRALDEGGLEEERRLFYVGITRAMRRLYLTYARSRRVFGDPAPAIESSFIEEIPPELIDFDEERGRLGVPGGPSPRRRGEFNGAWAAMSVGRDEVASRAASRVRARDFEAPRFRLGEDIVHAAFGEGVVTGVEPDGVIVVRFSGDGSERKLVAEYAPLSKR